MQAKRSLQRRLALLGLLAAPASGQRSVAYFVTATRKGDGFVTDVIDRDAHSPRRSVAAISASNFANRANSLQIHSVNGPIDQRYIRHLSAIVHTDFCLDHALELLTHSGNQLAIRCLIDG